MAFLLARCNKLQLVIKLTIKPKKFIYIVYMYVTEPPNIASFKTFTIIIFSVSALNNTIISVRSKTWNISHTNEFSDADAIISLIGPILQLKLGTANQTVGLTKKRGEGVS